MHCRECEMICLFLCLQFRSVQLFNHVPLFATPWIAARQASLSITNSWSSPKLMSIKSVMPFSHLIFCHPLLLLPPIPPSIRVFSNESTLCMRWPKYWSFSFSICPSKEHPGLISFRMASGRFKLGQSSWGKKLQTFIGGRSLPPAGLRAGSPETSHCIPSLAPSLLCSHSTSWGCFCSNRPWQREHPSEPALVDLF